MKKLRHMKVKSLREKQPACGCWRQNHSRRLRLLATGATLFDLRATMVRSHSDPLLLVPLDTQRTTPWVSWSLAAAKTVRWLCRRDVGGSQLLSTKTDKLILYRMNPSILCCSSRPGETKWSKMDVVLSILLFAYFFLPSFKIIERDIVVKTMAIRVKQMWVQVVHTHV